MKGQESENQKFLKLSQPSHNPRHYWQVEPKKNRISLTSATAKLPEKESIHSAFHEEQSNLQQKEQRIKQLQEANLDEKQRNDAIEEAFVQRKQASNFFKKDEFPEIKLKILGDGMRKVASQHIFFKKQVLKTLVAAFKFKKQNRAKHVKILLIWLATWLNRMFTLLGSSF